MTELTIATESRADPQPDDVAERQIAAMVEILGSVVPDSVAVYVSTPITTGTRFVAWRRGAGRHIAQSDPGYRAARYEHVIAPNIDAARPVVARLRRQGELVIDPTALDDVEHWQQQHYHDLWTRVVDRYARSVVFVDGWEYSVGALHELARALSRGLPVFDDELRQLEGAVIHRRVAEAIADVTSDGVIDAKGLRASLAEIDEAVGAG